MYSQELYKLILFALREASRGCSGHPVADARNPRRKALAAECRSGIAGLAVGASACTPPMKPPSSRCGLLRCLQRCTSSPSQASNRARRFEFGDSANGKLAFRGGVQKAMGKRDHAYGGPQMHYVDQVRANALKLQTHTGLWEKWICGGSMRFADFSRLQDPGIRGDSITQNVPLVFRIRVRRLGVLPRIHPGTFYFHSCSSASACPLDCT